MTHYLHYLKSKPYTYGKHLVPHDADVHEYSTGLTRLADIGINDGIDAVRNLLNRCWFDESRCAKGITALEIYKKE